MITSSAPGFIIFISGLHKDNLKLVNKDFRIVIPDGSVGLVLVLNFPEVRIIEDERGRIHEQLMKCVSKWLKDSGLLAMHVEERFLPRAICEKPPLDCRIASTKALTAIVEKEDESHILTIGPIPAAKGAICALNEIGRMYFDDQKHLLHVMQEQFFTINKHGIPARISSPTAIIARTTAPLRVRSSQMPLSLHTNCRFDTSEPLTK